jgi:hypothetical protein
VDRLVRIYFMKTSDREKRKLCMEWKLIAEEWEAQAEGKRPLSGDTKHGEPRTREERAAMARCIRDCAKELEDML